jgi:hypothetical protein
MALPKLFKSAQSQSGREVVPVAFTYLEAGGYGDSAAPGIFHPFLADVDGNLFVSIGGSGGPIAIPDDADAVAEVATDTRIPTVARMYGFDQGGTFSRIRTDDDSDESSAADGLPTLRVMGRNRLYNSINDAWEREHGNEGITALASAARTVSADSGTLLNPNAQAAHFIVDVSAIVATPSIVVTIEGRDVASLVWYPLLIANAITTVGTTVLKVGRAFTAQPNLTANDLLPYIYRVSVANADADSITYSIGVNLSV